MSVIPTLDGGKTQAQLDLEKAMAESGGESDSDRSLSDEDDLPTSPGPKFSPLTSGPDESLLKKDGDKPDLILNTGGNNTPQNIDYTKINIAIQDILNRVGTDVNKAVSGILGKTIDPNLPQRRSMAVNFSAGVGRLRQPTMALGLASRRPSESNGTNAPPAGRTRSSTLMKGGRDRRITTLRQRFKDPNGPGSIQRTGWNPEDLLKPKNLRGATKLN